MKKISRLLNYLADYKGKIGLYFLFNLLSILFGLLSFTLLIPVLNILFGAKDAKPVPVVTKQSVGFIKETINSFIELIQHQDKLTALAYVCICVVLFTVL